MWRLRFSRLRHRKVIKAGIVGYMQRVAIMVLITLIVTFILSLFISVGFKTILKYSILAVAIIGALSVLGGMGISNSYGYMINKANSNMTSATREDIELRMGSYSFCIFMGVSAGILYFIYTLI